MTRHPEKEPIDSDSTPTTLFNSNHENNLSPKQFAVR